MSQSPMNPCRHPDDLHRRRPPGPGSERPTLRRSPGAVHSRFDVRLHQTQRRHFDLRLEVGGGLRQWAVPRGPSLDAEQKRLAVEVDIDPHEAANPEVQRAPLAVWDQGHWQPDSDPLRGLAEGRLGFTLYGQRLHGRWSLVRTESRDDLLGRPQWLLLKAKDSWVRSGDIADDRPLAAIAGDASAPPAQAALPGLADLQLASSVADVPDGSDWLHEAMCDGYRLLIQRSGDEVQLRARSGADWTARLPHLVDAVRSLRCRSLVLDAELVTLDRQGRSDLDQLQRQMARDGDPRGTLALASDLLLIDGHDLRGEAQLRRKRELARLLRRHAAPLRVADYVVGDGTQQFRAACDDGLPGILSKRCSAAYTSGHSGAWLKVRCAPGDDFAVIGYLTRDGTAALDSLLLGRPVADRWQYAGRLERGFDEALRATLPARLKPRREPPPLLDSAALDALQPMRPIWVSPGLIVEARYDALDADGVLCNAALAAVRDDRCLADLQPADEHATAECPTAPTIARRKSLTDPGRRLFAQPAINKRELADFYAGLAEWLMPGLRNRPLSLLRCPDGIDGSCHYETRPGHGFPRSVHETRIAGPHGRSMKVFYVDDVDGLIGLAEMHAVEIHSWGASLNDIEHPDRLIFALEPCETLAWSRVVEAARALRDHLQALQLQSFVRTSGGRGLHVLVPLQARAGWPAATQFARDVARQLARAEPQRYTDLAGERNRKGRVFINALRNRRGASSISSYSLRARSGAPIATPLAWRELGRLQSADQYSYDSLPDRLARLRGDPWAGYQQPRQTLPETSDET
ncbi:MAG TPA: DNA ligase D [Fontimonas sp.]